VSFPSPTGGRSSRPPPSGIDATFIHPVSDPR
jgi:hypothetical protein